MRDLEATRGFYREPSPARTAPPGRRIVFGLRTASTSRISCELARAAGPGPQPKGVPGLYHIAFDVGASLDALAQARRTVEGAGLTAFGETATSFCVRDPDGHEIELYVETRPAPV